MAHAKSHANWFDSPAGRHVIGEESALLEPVYSTLFGYWMVQVGAWGQGAELLSGSKIRAQTVVDRTSHSGFACAPQALAIAADSVDAVLLPHTLEHASKPHAVLREVERVLVGEGRLIILGFSPWSFWGWRRKMAMHSSLPWAGRYISEWRLKDWLSVLGFEVIQEQHYLHGLPSEHPQLLRRLAFTRALGRYCWPGLAGGYFIMARKRMTMLTPIKLRRIRREKKQASRLAHPAPRTRSSCHV